MKGVAMNAELLSYHASLLLKTLKILIEEDRSLECFSEFFFMLKRTYDNTNYAYEIHHIRFDERKELCEKLLEVSKLLRDHTNSQAKLEAL